MGNRFLGPDANGVAGLFAKGTYGANFSGDDGMSISDWTLPTFRAPFSAVAQQGQKISDVKDGTSHTIFIGEMRNSIVVALDDGRGAWGHVGGCHIHCGSDPFCSAGIAGCNYNGDPTTVYTPNSKYEVDRPSHCTQSNPLSVNFCVDDNDVSSGMVVRSRHPAGAQICMGDGTVRFVTDDVDVRIWRDMFSSGGGEVFKEF